MCARELVVIKFSEVCKEWKEEFKNRVHEAFKKQGVKVCGEGLDPRHKYSNAKRDGWASKRGLCTHSLASAIEAFMKFIQGKKRRQVMLNR